MLTALDANLKRVRVFNIEDATPPFFCQLCGEEMEEDFTPEGMRHWKHKGNPCPLWEADTSEHLRMKHTLAALLPTRLKPELEYPVADTILDILLPELKVNIECQVQPQTLYNMTNRMRRITKLGYFTLWVWFQRKNHYAKLEELGRQQTYHKLDARLVEGLILSQFFTEAEPSASTGAFWDDYDLAAKDEFRPRYYTYCAGGRFYWLNIIRRYGDKFDFTDLGVELYKTDIGRLAAFIRRERTDKQKGLT
jgi:hypothetical protein